MGDSVIPQIDDWFRLEDYDCVADFGMAEWLVALHTRLDYEMGQPEKRGEDLEKLWKEFLARTRPANVKHLLASDEFKWAFEPSLAVEEIRLEDIHGDQRAKAIEQDVELLGKRMLLVNPDASDQMLVKEFRNWLRRYREIDPLPVRHKGETRITEAHLRSWHHYGVLACFDLDYWAKVFGQGRVSYVDLCDRICGPNFQGNAKQWGRQVRPKYDEAMASLRILIAGVMK